MTLEFSKIRSELPRDTRYTIAQDLSRVLLTPRHRGAGEGDCFRYLESRSLGEKSKRPTNLQNSQTPNSESNRNLYGIVPRVREFLRGELELELNEDKVRVVDAYKGVEFLGAYVKPYRTYPSTRSLRRMRGRLKSLDWAERPHRIQARVNSMFGVLSHYDCYQMRKVLVHQGGMSEYGDVSDDCLRFYPDLLKFQLKVNGGIR